MNEEPRCEVVKHRDGDVMEIWVIDHRKGVTIPFDFVSALSTFSLQPWLMHRVSLKDRWWNLSTPSERIREVVAKAQRKADKVNHREMYIGHEAELARRQP
jgi:hypothetical protein